jgi:hypothetical protein
VLSEISIIEVPVMQQSKAYSFPGGDVQPHIDEYIELSPVGG